MPKRKFDAGAVVDLLSDVSDISDDDDESDFDITMVLSDSETDGGEESDDDSPNDQIGNTIPGVTVGWRRWMSNDTDFSHFSFTVQNTGPNFQQVPQTELECFQSFMTDELMREIITATNAYAAINLHGRTLNNNSVWYKWKNVTFPEFKAYLGVVLKMAVIEKADIKDYFSREWTEETPFFLDVFSRRRFLQIHWMLHVQSPEPTTQPITRSRKISNVVDYVKKKCIQIYTPRQSIAVDESTVGFKGRISFKTYNPQKPTKWGLRVYVLCDSENGYISTFEPYFGQPTTANLPYPQMPFTVRIVLHLVDQLLKKADGSGYHVYTDRFYTSILLANQLLQKQIHLTGTVQKNRVGLPSDLKKLKLKNHEIKVYRHQDEVMTLAWLDKRLILMLSTWHNADTTILKRWINGEEIEVIKPTVVCDYTSKMGGVDRADHYCASYSFTRKTLKWWRKMFYWLLEVCVVNSFILFKELHHLPTAERQLKYRNKLIAQLVGTVRNTTNRRGRLSTSDDAERLNQAPHFINKLVKGPNKNCQVCSAKDNRKTTVFFCETCARKPYLHPGECFKRYHTLQNFKL